MELAGLQPATSWVRSSCSSEREMACLQPVSGECLEGRNISRNISASDLQRDECLRRQCPSGSETNAIHPEAPYVCSQVGEHRENAAVIVGRLLQSELPEDLPHVRLDRLGTEEQRLADGPVRAPLGHEPEGQRRRKDPARDLVGLT
jgi:hypothetical protein